MISGQPLFTHVVGVQRDRAKVRLTQLCLPLIAVVNLVNSCTDELDQWPPKSRAHSQPPKVKLM